MLSCSDEIECKMSQSTRQKTQFRIITTVLWMWHVRSMYNAENFCNKRFVSFSLKINRVLLFFLSEGHQIRQTDWFRLYGGKKYSFDGIAAGSQRQDLSTCCDYVTQFLLMIWHCLKSHRAHVNLGTNITPEYRNVKYRRAGLQE